LWKGATGKAAVIQMIVTMIFIPLWQVLPKTITGGINGLTIGMIVAPIVFIIASKLTKNSNPEDIDMLWDEYKAANVGIK
jgi:Na+/proline symporter